LFLLRNTLGTAKYYHGEVLELGFVFLIYQIKKTMGTNFEKIC